MKTLTGKTQDQLDSIAAEAERLRRISEIMAEFEDINSRLLRPLLAKAQGKASKDDEKKLEDMDARAAALRIELAHLKEGEK